MPKKFPEEVESRLAQLIAQGDSAPEIADALMAEFPDLPEGDIHSYKTITRRITTARGLDASGRWTALDEPSEDAQLLLPVLREVVERSKGRRSYLTKGEAKFVKWLLESSPSLPPWKAYLLARACVEADATESLTDHIELALVFWSLPAGPDDFLVGERRRDARERLIASTWRDEETTMRAHALLIDLETTDNWESVTPYGFAATHEQATEIENDG